MRNPRTPPPRTTPSSPPSSGRSRRAAATTIRLRLGLFRGRLLRAAGVAACAGPLVYASACTQEVIVVDGGGGASGTGGAGATNSVAVSSVDSGSVVTATSGSTGANTSSSSTGGGVQNACFYMPDGGCPALMDAEPLYGPCTLDSYFIDSWNSGPFVQNGECCYNVSVSGDFCGVGRPFVVTEGAAVAAVAVDNHHWLDEYDTSIPLSLGPLQRSELASMWACDALFEHASVASFARVSLELMALGAPADLVEDTHLAALDEVHHAKMCFALASRFAGRPMGAGPLPAAAEARPRSGLVAVAVATLVEGCIGETIAAALAREQQLRASDEEIAEVLGQIADDEAHHAELAWRTVAWAVRAGGEEVRLALRATLRDAPRHLPAVQGASDRSLEVYGRLSHGDVEDVARRTLVEVVLPCAHALLAPPEGALLRRQARVV